MMLVMTMYCIVLYSIAWFWLDFPVLIAIVAFFCALSEKELKELMGALFEEDEDGDGGCNSLDLPGEFQPQLDEPVTPGACSSSSAVEFHQPGILSLSLQNNSSGAVASSSVTAFSEQTECHRGDDDPSVMSRYPCHIPPLKYASYFYLLWVLNAWLFKLFCLLCLRGSLYTFVVIIWMKLLKGKYYHQLHALCWRVFSSAVAYHRMMTPLHSFCHNKSSEALMQRHWPSSDTVFVLTQRRL